MDTRQFEYILAIADEKFVSKAADRLCISQPTLSQFLSRIEKDLGVPLFRRSRGGFSPTAEGEILIDGARRILRIKEEVLARVAPYAERRRRRLIVGLTPGRSARLFSVVMPLFSREAPEIDVQIVEAPIQNIDELTRNGYLDFSLISVNQDDGQLAYESFGAEEILFAVDRSRPPAETDGGVDVRRFAAERFILSRRGSRLRQTVESHMERLGFKPASVLEAAEIPLICGMILDGLGVGFIPAWFARMHPGLACCPLSPRLHWDFGAVYRKGVRPGPPMRRFIDLAKGCAGKLY